MEKLLHYVWQHRLLPLTPLITDSGERVDIIDPGLPNHNAGPDFFNAKVKIGTTLWVGNVELHLAASDWYRHGHDSDRRYDSVILHVCSNIDTVVTMADGRHLPQLQLDIAPQVKANYAQLLAENAFPPCYRVVPTLPAVAVHAWLARLTAERIEEKTQRILHLLHDTGGNWEQTAFITLARNFGFGVNADAFELWARSLPLRAVGKHRDDAFQVEAFFMGQAGLLSNALVPVERRDDYFLRLQNEYTFLQRKFSTEPINPSAWRFLRLRPQNFPHIRLSQLATLYHSWRFDLSHLLAADTPAALRALLYTTVSDYWLTHYAFGRPSALRNKSLHGASTDLLVINTVAPLLFAYGRHHADEALCERALSLLEATRCEHNHIVTSWAAAGIKAENAADSQALIQLRQHYCDTKDCLRCRFGAAYLRQDKAPVGH